MKNKGLDLGEGPILPLLLKMSWPSIAALFAMALYNLIDTFWLARLNPQAVAALTVCFPIQIIFGAIGVGTGVGAGSFAARMFGAGQQTKARQTAGQAILLSVLLGFVIIVITLTYQDAILEIFGAAGDILPLSRQYLVTVVIGCPFLLFLMVTNNLLRAEGNPKASMYVILVMSLTGAILDPFLIFGLGKLPMLGIFGAAISAVISYFLASLLSLYYLRVDASKYNLIWSHLIPDFSIIASIYQTGFPSIIMNFVYSIVMIVYNHVLGGFGPMAIAALGLCFRINHLVIMVLFGMGHGIMPIVGFSEGAALHKRLMDTVNCAVKISVLFSAAAFVLLEAFAHPILLLFTSDPELISIAVPAVRIFATMLLLVGPNLVWINMFIGLGKGFTSMLLLMMRDTLLLIPMLLYLPSLFGLAGVWAAQPVANLLAFFVILYWKKREFRMIEEKI